jgi:Transposase DDE domain
LHADSQPDIVAIDGKTLRRVRGGDNYPLHVVSAWTARQGLVLGQQATDAKSNEITAIPLLLARLQPLRRKPRSRRFGDARSTGDE